jgi:hypothetical protein
MARKVIRNVNAYVENATGYRADAVAVDLNEGTLTVTAYPVDTDGAKVSGAANLVNKTLANLTKAIAYYEEIVHQVEQGDIIRNV